MDKDESSILDKGSTFDPEAENRKQQSSKEEQIYQKQQILDELHVRVLYYHAIKTFFLLNILSLEGGKRITS